LASKLHIVCPDWSTKPDCAAFAIDSLLEDGESKAIALLDNQNVVFGFVGDPGWSVERRKVGLVEDEEQWPSWASVRIWVDPAVVGISPHEVFLTDDQFIDYLRRFYLAFGYPLSSLNRVAG
jgi:hypothetical protein